MKLINLKIQKQKLEMWKTIKDFPDYRISTLGRVKSYKRNRINGSILKPKNNGYDYLHVDLYNNNKTKRFKIHRLVAEAFIPNPDNKPYIDHINTIRTDNCTKNLKWVTHKENCNNKLTKKNNSESHKGVIFSESHKRKISESCKKYSYYCKELDMSFDSLQEAEKLCRKLGIKVCSLNIYECCRNLRKYAGKYYNQKLTWIRKEKTLD